MTWKKQNTDLSISLYSTSHLKKGFLRNETDILPQCPRLPPKPECLFPSVPRHSESSQTDPSSELSWEKSQRYEGKDSAHAKCASVCVWTAWSSGAPRLHRSDKSCTCPWIYLCVQHMLTSHMLVMHIDTHTISHMLLIISDFNTEANFLHLHAYVLSPGTFHAYPVFIFFTQQKSPSELLL